MFKAKNEYLEIIYANAAFTNYPSRLAIHLAERFKLKPKQKILDLGCGRGEFLKGFVERDLEGYGVDQSDIARQIVGDATIKVADLDHRLPFEDDFFDVVYSKSVIEHFYYPEKLLKEARRVLKPGGLIISMTPDWKHNIVSFHTDYTNRTAFTLKSIDNIHRIQGFVDVRSERFIQLPIYWKFKVIYPLIWLARHLVPDMFKANSKFVRFSKEVMLLTSGLKP